MPRTCESCSKELPECDEFWIEDCYGKTYYLCFNCYRSVKKRLEEAIYIH